MVVYTSMLTWVRPRRPTGLVRLRALLSLLAVSSSLAGIHAHARGGERVSSARWDGVSRLRTEVPADKLRATAEDKQADRTVRAKAVFSLFANYLRPPKDGRSIAAVLGAAPWLAESRLDGIHGVGGLVPLETIFDGTPFVLALFPNKQGVSDWTIVFRLSGAEMPVAGARALLSGTGTKGADSTLIEFSLCFPPDGTARVGRVEHFTVKGVSVFSP